jgi:Aminoglycoside-2''-adenylyltransferase
MEGQWRSCGARRRTVEREDAGPCQPPLSSSPVELSDADARRRAEQQLAALADVGALLDEGGFDHWLFGGWAVDFHAGAVTRSHGDIDLAVWAEDAEAIHSALASGGWQHRPAPEEDGGTGYERRGVRVELTYLARGEAGEVFIALHDENVLWSESPLGDEVLSLQGARTHVIPLELLRRGKARPRDDPDEALVDRSDFDTLSRLGT